MTYLQLSYIGIRIKQKDYHHKIWSFALCKGCDRSLSLCGISAPAVFAAAFRFKYMESLEFAFSSCENSMFGMAVSVFDEAILDSKLYKGGR